MKFLCILCEESKNCWAIINHCPYWKQELMTVHNEWVCRACANYEGMCFFSILSVFQLVIIVIKLIGMTHGHSDDLISWLLNSAAISLNQYITLVTLRVYIGKVGVIYSTFEYILKFYSSSSTRYNTFYLDHTSIFLTLASYKVMGSYSVQHMSRVMDGEQTG